ncbi:MAG: serine aminopeptidase domain-containing protein [Rhodanobacteraceae bacterium]
MKPQPGLLFALIGVMASAAAFAAPRAVDTCMANAQASLDAVVQGHYAAAGKDFATVTAKALPPAKIEQAWTDVQKRFGVYRSHGTLHPLTFQGKPVVVTPVRFANGPLDFVVACDASNRITLFYLLKPSVVEAPAPIKAHTKANGVRIEPLFVPSPFGPLRGALTLPAGEGLFPAVVLVGGSGPNDLDETVGGSKPFRDIANGLAAAGIASLRYDKRQTDYPLQMSANAHLTVDEEETDDALTAAHLLAKQRGINPHRVFVLGHSEGGMLVPRIGQRDPSLAGLILLAAPARKLLAVSRQQVREQGQRLGLPATQIHASEEALAAEQKLLDKADPKNPPQGEFGGAPQTWWLSLHGYDQVAVAKSLQLPMLILQGGSDFQVSPKYDFDLWKQALAGKSNVTFHLYPGLSHLFTPAGRTMTSADYAKPAHVDPTVIQEIDKWIKAQPAK